MSEAEERKGDIGEAEVMVNREPDGALAAINSNAALEPITVYRRGHPLPHDLRARAMLLLQQGIPKQTIAKRLCLSRSTLLRYQKASESQVKAVPIVKPRGGYRAAVALLNRQQILQLGEMLLSQPKLTIRELKQQAVDAAILDPDKVPSDTTIWRAVKKLDLDFSKASYIDPKGAKQYAAERKADDANENNNEEEKQGSPPEIPGPARNAGAPARVMNTEEADLIAAERKAFRFVQKQGPEGQLNPFHLIFMDETNGRAFDQAHYAWGRRHERTFLFRPKGMSPTFNIIACIGVEEDTPGQMFLHYIIIPPRRDFRGVPTKWKGYEFRNPTAGIDIGFSVSQIQRTLTLVQLKELMAAQQIRIPQGFTDDALEAELRRILVQVRTHGKVGMFREVAKKQKYLGGSVKAFRSTAADVVDYIEQLMIPFYAKRKFHGLVHECSEDSDGVVGCPDAGHHFSVPYVPPRSVSRFELLRSKQRTQRQWQRAAHHHLVYSRSRKAQTEAGESMLVSLRAQEQRKQQEASAAADAWTRYERQMERAGSYVPFQDELGGAGYKRKLSNKYLIWDCASTHGAVRISSSRKKSFWHSYAVKAGMKGVVFLPPRTPTLNPIELAFGFVKHHVRKQCPDEGYTSVALLQAIHNAFRLITPQMIKNWVKKAGYRFTSPRQQNIPAASHEAAADLDGPVRMEIDGEDDEKSVVELAAEMQEPNVPAQPNIVVEDCYSQPGTVFHRKRSIVCMDEHGTVIRKKHRRSKTFDRVLDKKLQHNPHWTATINMTNIAPTVNQMQSVANARVVPYSTEEEAFQGVGVSRRWSGLGPEPEHLHEMMPESIVKVQDGTLWEIDGIVEHRRARSGTNV